MVRPARINWLGVGAGYPGELDGQTMYILGLVALDWSFIRLYCSEPMMFSIVVGTHEKRYLVLQLCLSTESMFHGIHKVAQLSGLVM